MAVKSINVDVFRQMILIANQRLSLQSQFVNDLNVFPVPDGDTGTNMSLTLMSGAKEVEQGNFNGVSELAQRFSKGLLMGARGNSGVILSQLFRGFAKGIGLS